MDNEDLRQLTRLLFEEYKRQQSQADQYPQEWIIRNKFGVVEC